MNQNKETYFYKYVVYTILVLYLLINISFNKTCLIFDASLDETLKIPHGTNLKTIAISTFFSALGKFFGVFISGSKKNIIFYTFLLNAICLILFIYSNFLVVFFIFRILQGFASGIQNGIIMGLLGSLNNCRKGFANYTTISNFISLFVGFLLVFITPKEIILSSALLSILAGFFVKYSLNLKENHFTFNDIEWRTIIKLGTNERFVIRTSFLGFFLGCSLLIITRQKTIITDVFHIKFEKISNALSVLTFLISGITSYFYDLHSRYLFNIMNLLAFVFISLGLITKSIYVFLFGIFLPLSAFSVVNPIVLEQLTLFSSNRFISSSLAACYRSFFTALTMFSIPLLTKYVFEVSLFSMFVTGVLYSYLYLYDE